jgi:soluble lytic murein transglycosylase-like protein
MCLWLLVLCQKGPDHVTYSSVTDSIFHNLSPLSSSVSSLFSTELEPPRRGTNRHASLDEILNILNSGTQTHTKYGQIIERAARLYDLDPDLLRAVILVESRFNPNAESPVGACGLMQLMPQTAKELGVENIFNPAENIYGGSKYLRKLLNIFNGNTKLALAGYNAGPGAVKNHGGIPPYKETRDYVKKVLTSYRLIRTGKTRVPH